jgi:nicotinamide-nucleotide amidase
MSLDELSLQVGQALQARGLILATAESCTGGWVAQVVTATAGSSGWFDRGFVTYSNQAKQDMLGVSADTLARHGAVSEPTARDMAVGALKHSAAQAALAITGIAGPGGGSPDKPVGMVCFAWALADGRVESSICHFSGNRETIRRQAVIEALQGLLRIL